MKPEERDYFPSDVLKPGIFPRMPMAIYLSMEAVSASLLKTLLTECPRKAWYDSYLNPSRPPGDDTDASDAGTIAHGILLEGSEKGISIGDFADFRTKDAQTWKKKIRELGNIPILAHKMPPIRAMVAEARRFLDDEVRTEEPAIWNAFQPDGGESETTIVWQDGPTLCRIRPDRLSSNRKLIADYKTTKTSAEPDRWGRTQMVGLGYYISAAFYRRGILATFCTQVEYVFLAQEQTPPYLCSLVGMDPHAFDLGNAKIESALRRWQECVASNRWPGYPARICYPEIPPWEQIRWDEQQADEEARGIEYSPEKLYGGIEK